MGIFRDRMKQDLELAGRAKRTQQAYLSSIRAFAIFTRRSPAEVGQEEVRRWIEQLGKSAISEGRIHQHIAALRFFYTKTVYRPDAVSFLTYPRLPDKLPVVLSIDEVERVLHALRALKYRVFFTTIYATGLRIIEGCHLETSNIEAERGIIRVMGKGNKERIVMLRPRLLGVLRAYWRIERPPRPWLFASQTGGPLRAHSAREALKLATAVADIGKHVTPHVLRHSFAAHLLEEGTQLRIIQVLLGHKNIATTTRYTRVSTELIRKVASPHDKLRRPL